MLISPIVAIIQARMGASRLPNKMLLQFNGLPLVEWVFKRVSKSKQLDKIIFAIPNSKQDDILANHLRSVGAEIFRGSELNLVKRYYDTAKKSKAATIVRVCADNPLICADQIDSLITFFKKHECEYAYNHIPKNNSWPDGLGAEICKFKLIKEIYEKAKCRRHQEHLFSYIWDNEENYHIATFDPPKQLAYPSLKFDVDTLDDYHKLLKIPFKIDMTAIEVVEMANEYDLKGIERN